MANYGDFRGVLEAILTKLKQISAHTNNSACCQAVTSAGTGSIPVGFSSISIVQTSASGSVNITMSDGSVFTLQTQGEVFVHAAGDNKFLPAYPIVGVGGGTWQWTGVK